MTPLPIDAYLPEIVARLKETRALVLVAPPGAGKTTRVPPAILRAGLLSPDHPNLVMLQPRRVAARAAAARIADENGLALGQEVGYHIRFERKLTDQTRLRVLTEGILTRQLLADPFLEGVGAVLLDEFHERSLHTDMAAALLREVRQTVREDLILVVMSATLDAEPVAKFLGGCPIVRTEGRTFPVEISYHPHATAPVPQRVADAVAQVMTNPTEDPGDVLVFLPGAEEIRRSQRLLEPLADRHDLLVLPLHGSLPADEQTLALRPASRRKVILSTNMAETSLTIDGVRTVVDAGLARVPAYDPHRGLDRLDLKRISQASAAQRAGRAGRTAPGRCVRLWSAKEQHALDPFELPEVRRVDLAGTVLTLHAWGKSDPRAFGWYEPPPEPMLAAAERLLWMLGALSAESKGALTPLGKRVADLPVHPRLGRLLLAAADAGALDQGAALAALLSEKDIALLDYGQHPRDRGPTTQGSSDLLVRLQMLEQAERERFAAHLRDRGIDPVGARQVAKTRDELLRNARRLARQSTGAADDETLLRLLLCAYPDRVCRRRAGDASAAAMVGGGGARLAPESVVRQGEFFLALDARHDDRSQAREAVVRIASRIEPEWLGETFPNLVRKERVLTYDESRGRVVARGITRYLDLPIAEDKDAPVDPQAAGAVLGEALRPRASEIFGKDEAASTLLARVDLLRKAMPEHPWPPFDAEQLGALIADGSAGKRSLEELERGGLSNLLRAALPYPLDRLLDQHAPETIEVPSGSRIGITYVTGQPPVLAARLQELFGWTDTPRIAAGRVSLLIHLLGPNYRPVQITNDLRSFWSTTYFQVRKDLRTRYPKHSWPEDPLSAKPEAKGRSRR